jgi:hypothetical protein
VRERLVNHRPRTRGVSKYGVGNRAWRGLVDCLAMRWYHRRCVSARRVLAPAGAPVREERAAQAATASRA